MVASYGARTAAGKGRHAPSNHALPPCCSHFLCVLVRCSQPTRQPNSLVLHRNHRNNEPLHKGCRENSVFLGSGVVVCLLTRELLKNPGYGVLRFHLQLSNAVPDRAVTRSPSSFIVPWLVALSYFTLPHTISPKLAATGSFAGYFIPRTPSVAGDVKSSITFPL